MAYLPFEGHSRANKRSLRTARSLLLLFFVEERIMQKLKHLLGILAIGLVTAVTLSAQNSGTFKGQVIQPDGKILIWGANMVISGVPSGFAARLNSNGSRDASFTFCGCGFTSVNRLLVQSDGKIIVTGNRDSTRS